MSKLIRRTVRKGGGAALLVALQMITLTLLSLIGPMASGPRHPANPPAGSQVQSSSSASSDSSSDQTDQDQTQTAQPRTAHDLTAAEKEALRHSAHFAKKLYEPLASQVFNLASQRIADQAAQRTQAPESP